jgi:hypothetical protein
MAEEMNKFEGLCRRGTDGMRTIEQLLQVLREIERTEDQNQRSYREILRTHTFQSAVGQ